MKFAYADPPYFGCAKKHYGVEAQEYDTLEGHKQLIERLKDGDYDGWALSMTSGNLRDLLFACPKRSRVMAWVKPFAIFKPNVNPAYAWEPVIVWGGRKRGRDIPTVRDWVRCNITLKKGLTGAKPKDFCFWLFEVLNMQPGDQFDDLFLGTGGVTAAWEEWKNPPPQPPEAE